MVEFYFDIKPLFPKPIIKLNRTSLSGESNKACHYRAIIDRMGLLSAQAQNLQRMITSGHRFINAGQQTIYMAADPGIGKNGVVVGFLKVGPKNLCLRDDRAQLHSVINARCILDFYVHASQQRRGYGKQLFERLLEDEKAAPYEFCVDKPSDKMLRFLKKHYGLTMPQHQANNYVIFDGYFGKSAADKRQPPLGEGVRNGLDDPNEKRNMDFTRRPNGRYSGRPIDSMGDVLRHK